MTSITGKLRVFKVLMVAATAALAAACVEIEPATSPPVSAARSAGPVGEATFQRVANAVIPVAQAECRARTSNGNCNFVLALDRDPKAQPNAYQSLSSSGQPQLTFTLTLLNDLENADELAFIMGHEASHHIRGHLARTTNNATLGAMMGGIVAATLGADVGTIDTAQRAGAVVGSRVYSKNFELEADELGTVITARAGYSPIRGAEYFTRIADPGNAFLGTHPPNADRMETVRRTVARM